MNRIFCCFLAVSNNHKWPRLGKCLASTLLQTTSCFQGPHWCLAGKMASMNPVCWFLFIFFTTKCKRRTTEDQNHSLPAPKMQSYQHQLPRSPICRAFKQKQKQTPARSNHKRDDWSWKTIMQKWSEPFLSSPTQNTLCHKCLWQFFHSVAQDKKVGGNSKCSQISHTHCTMLMVKVQTAWVEGGREKNYNRFNLKADHFYLTDLKRNSDLRVGCKPSHTKHWWPCRGILV